MKRGPVSYRRPNWPKDKVERIRALERAFHVREFGEELARVNFDLTIEERHQYLAWMREAARKKGGSKLETGDGQDRTGPPLPSSAEGAVVD